jgi:hypothetical protein
VIADDGAAAADRQAVQGNREGVLQLAQLVVHGDAQGLEDPLGRVALAPDGGRDGGSHDIGQLERRGERPGLHDGPGDPTGQAALAVLPKEAARAARGAR